MSMGLGTYCKSIRSVLVVWFFCFRPPNKRLEENKKGNGFSEDTWHTLSQSFFCWSRPRTNSVHSWERLMGFGTVTCWLSISPSLYKEGLTPCLCPSCNRWCCQAFDQNVTFIHLLLNFSYSMTCCSPWILPNFT